jgi:hypothetical protein
VCGPLSDGAPKRLYFSAVKRRNGEVRCPIWQHARASCGRKPCIVLRAANIFVGLMNLLITRCPSTDPRTRLSLEDGRGIVCVCATAHAENARRRANVGQKKSAAELAARPGFGVAPDVS